MTELDVQSTGMYSIPANLWTDKKFTKLSCTARLLFLVLYNLCNQFGFSEYNNHELGEKIATNHKTISRKIKELSENGWIEVVPLRGNDRAIFINNLDKYEY